MRVWLLLISTLGPACQPRDRAPAPVAVDAGPAAPPVVRWPEGSLHGDTARFAIGAIGPANECTVERAALEATAKVTVGREALPEWLPDDIPRVATDMLVFRVETARANGGAALRAASALGTCLGGTIVDLDARRAYDVEEWSDRGDSILEHVAFVVTAHGDLRRGRTTGMARWALPEIVVQGFSAGNEAPLHNLVMLTAQAMRESPRIERAGRFLVDARALRDQSLVAHFSFSEGAGKSVELTVVEAPGRQIELRFAGGAGARVAMNVALQRMFGRLDAPSATFEADAEFEKAVEASRARLLAERERIRAAMADGAALAIVGQFVEGEDMELLWIDVHAWDGATLKGTLDNDPDFIRGLRRGSDVEIPQDEVIDWKLTRPDGTQEGRTVMDLLEARQWN